MTFAQFVTDHPLMTIFFVIVGYQIVSELISAIKAFSKK